MISDYYALAARVARDWVHFGRARLVILGHDVGDTSGLVT